MSSRTALFLLVATLAVQALNAERAFTVDGSTILDANGNPFVMRGINHAHSWYKDDAEQAIPAIAKSGANVIRLVLSDGQTYTKDEASEVKKLLDLCESNNLIAILEVHDGTGSDDQGMLQNAVDYWISLSDLLTGREDKVIINIANEWYGSSKSKEWADGYVSAIQQLRGSGFRHLFIVDTAGWGQYAAAIAEEGRRVLSADPLSRTIFSIHMYEVAAPDSTTVKNNIDASLAVGAVIVGEFSDKQNGKPVDYQTIMDYCRQKNVGWLAWSWYGNNDDTANMDLVTSPTGELTALGKEIVEGPNGIRATVKPASVW